jgi:hypothetical protein
MRSKQASFVLPQDADTKKWYAPESLADIKQWIGEMGQEFVSDFLKSAGGPPDLLQIALAG